MFKRLIVLLSLCLLPLAQAGAESGWQGDYASDIKVDTLYLDNNLSSADDTVQKALETIDSLTLGSFSGDADDIDEGTTHLFLTTDERTILSNTSGTNTGDQDLSGYLLATGATTGATSSAQTFTNGIIGNVTGNVSGSSGSCTGNAATVTNGVYTTDIGSTVQAYDSDLTTWAGITPGANVGTFLSTPSSANLSTAVTDETGSGALVFGTSPVFTTQITSPKIYNAGDMTIDAYNAASDSTVTITNSDGTYDANLSIDGDLTVKNILVQDGGVLQLGYDTVDGELRIYSEQGVTDYIAHLFANTAMTSAANFYLPADEPASTQFLTMTSGGAIGFDTLGFGALSDPDANTILGWDDTDGAMKTMTIGTGLAYDHATHTISSTAGATALDDIADPDAATSISTDDGENLTFLTAVDGENFLAIHQTAASVTATTYLLDLGYNADADTEADFILCRDDLDGTPAEMFKVEYNGDTTTAGNINAAALYTSSLNNGTSSNDITIDASGDDIWVVGGTNLQFGNASTNAGAIYLRNGALGGDPMVTMQMSTNDFAVTTDTGDINLVPTGGDVNVTGAVVVDAAGVKISSDGDGALTLLGLGDGFDESLTVNLDDTENTAVVSSATGVTKIDCGSIVLEGAFSSSDGTAGASATTGGLTFKDGLYTSGTATDYSTGWLAGETWAYASASSFTVSGVDVTAKYSKGTRLKFVQSATTKYAVVISSSFSTNTTVNILVNTDYTIANDTISGNYYSYTINPQGYPGWFNVAAPTFSGIDNGSGGQPTVTEHRARVDGSVYKAHLHIGNTAYKDGTTHYFSWTGAVACANTTARSVIGTSYWNTAADASYVGTVMNTNSTTFYSLINSNDVPADNTQFAHIGIDLQYEI